MSVRARAPRRARASRGLGGAGGVEVRELADPGAAPPDVADGLLADAEGGCDLGGAGPRLGVGLIQVGEVDREDLGGLVGGEDGSGLACLDG